MSGTASSSTAAVATPVFNTGRTFPSLAIFDFATGGTAASGCVWPKFADADMALSLDAVPASRRPTRSPDKPHAGVDSAPCQPGPDSRISNWRGAVSGCGNNRGRHLTAWADREMQAERFRTYSKMKGLMALATGLSMIFQIWRTCGRRACDLPALPTRDLVGDEVALHGRTGRQVGRGAQLLTGARLLEKAELNGRDSNEI